MKQGFWRSALWVCLALEVLSGRIEAQTRVHLNRQGKAADFASFQGGVRPWRAGSELPESCSEGEAYFRTDLPAGHNLFFCLAGNTWKATSYDPGIGIVMAGNVIQVEDSVIPTYRTGHGAPDGNCSPGRDFYLDLDSSDLHFCAGENTWSNLRQGPHTHSAAEILSGVLASARGGTGSGTAETNAVLIGNGSGWVKAVLPACSSDTTSKLLYDDTTRSFSCGTDQAGVAGPGATTTESYWLLVAASSTSTVYPNAWMIPSAGGPTVVRVGTAPYQFGAMAFADGSDQSASSMVALHPNFQSGGTLAVYWYASISSTAKVRWGATVSCAGIGEAIPAAESPAASAETTHSGVISGLNKTILALDTTGCSGGDLLTIRLLREGTHANDTLTSNAAVVGAQLIYTRGQ